MVTKLPKKIVVVKSVVRKVLLFTLKTFGVIVILFCISLLLFFINRYLDRQYINKQFNTTSLRDAAIAFDHHFVTGMPREEVWKILLKIDPGLENQIHENISCNNSPFSDLCSETLCLFQQRVGWMFCPHFVYNEDLLFLRITYD